MYNLLTKDENTKFNHRKYKKCNKYIWPLAFAFIVNKIVYMTQSAKFVTDMSTWASYNILLTFCILTPLTNVSLKYENTKFSPENVKSATNIPSVTVNKIVHMT